MKYFTGRFTINDGGRYSIQKDNTEVKTLLIDEIYNDNLKEDGFTCVYFGQKPTELEFTAKEINNYAIDFMTIPTAISWIKANTKLQEIEPGKFLISPETEMMGEIIPAKYLIIE